MNNLVGKRYKILSGLGSGSTGDVYLAIDSRSEDKICLKILRSGTKEFEENFIREFEILSRLNHPGLIPVHDFGIDPEYGPYFSMEYASGGDLGELKAVTPREFFSISSSICRALEYIHNQGLVHGDIKPTNILIDSSKNYRLVDFGLSFISGDTPISSPGSAAFISPEIIRRNAMTTRSDIYSLGLLLYELIFGKPFYEGGAGEIISKKLSGVFQLPEVPEGFGGKRLKDLLRKMIDSDPHNRFESAGAVLDEIEDIFKTYEDFEESKRFAIEKSKFVGRNEELEWLSRGLVISEGEHHNFFFIGGEPGVGKSRLMDDFRIRAQIQGFRFFKSYCREKDLKPLSPIISLLNYIFIELDPDMEIFADYGPDLKRLFPEKFGEITPEKYEMSEAEVAAGRRRMFDNLTLYLNHISRKEKLAVLVEDFHWADNETREFIRFFKYYPAFRGTLIFICSGQTETDMEVPDFLTDDKSSFRILQPVDKKDMSEFINGILGGVELPDEFYDRLFDETGGNFLYTEEIIKTLSSEGQFERDRGKWVLNSGWEEKITVPEGIKSLLVKKLERLELREKEIVELAAVLGESFMAGEIEDLLEDYSIQRYVDNLVRNGIFEKSEIGRRERIYFTNGQLEKLIYGSISQEKLKKLHQKIAGYYSGKGASPEFLGRHFALAGIYEKGFTYNFQSAVAAEKVFSFKQAFRFYQSAGDCAGYLPDNRLNNLRGFQSLLGRGKAMNFLSPADATDSLLNAFSLAEAKFGVGAELAEAGLILGQNLLNTGENEKAKETFRKTLSAAKVSGDRRFEGEAQIGLGFTADKIGDLKEAENCYLKALDVFADIDLPEGSCKVLNYLGIIRKRQGDLTGAEDFYRRSLDICLDKGFLWSAMNLYGNIGNLYASKGDYRKAQLNYSRSLEISKEISDRRIESIVLLNIGHSLNEIGDLYKAEAIFFEAIDKFKTLGDKGSEAIALNNLGFLNYRKGQISDSIKFYSEGLELADEISRPRIKLANLIGLAEVHAAVADFENAGKLAVQAVELAEEIDDNEQLATALPILAMVNDSLLDTKGVLKSVRKFLKLKPEIGKPRQRIKAYLLAQKYKNDLMVDIGPVEAEIKKISGKNPEVYPVIIAFNAQNFLESDSLSNPEIWLARIDEALEKANDFYQFREKIKLMALKLDLLRLIRDSVEAGRQEEKLVKEIARATGGLDDSLIDNLKKYLGIHIDGDEQGEYLMNKVNRNERLAVLLRIAHTINSIRESEPLLNKILDLALETLEGERGFIMLYSNDSLEPVVARNIAREDILGETTISQSSALEVARLGKPILLSGADDDISARQSVADFRISSLLCVPLAVKGKVHGIVYVDSRSGTIFSDDDLDFLVSFADLAAIAFENARMAEQLKDKNIYLQQQVESTLGFGSIVGRSSPMQRVFRMAESVANTDVTVVLTGDSGTGKEILARAIHLASPRKNAKFVPVDCGALTETLLESELFGHVKGSFTGATADRAGLFEVAQGGTIFLDEITNTGKNFQVKLLRVLQENEIRRVGESKSRKIDVRVITATNKPLESEVESGDFREDLYYRLNVVNILLPSLRERNEDIPILAAYFLEKICKKMNLPVKIFSSEALDFLLRYSWPGNVRQLENVCERMVVFTRGELVDIDMLPPEIKTFKQSPPAITTETKIPKTRAELKAEKARLDRLFIVGLLEKSEGNVMQAARLSGMDRSQIHHMMSKFGISSADFKG
ncbi:MAG: sigma 54-interacting transcriptional regulator [Candidatus Zixiibacteriota bacterium]|nr:MAG: sigma 54-interacting transcriptional regulator [candidate division Zixibacteria bacterium]